MCMNFIERPNENLLFQRSLLIFVYLVGDIAKEFFSASRAGEIVFQFDRIVYLGDDDGAFSSAASFTSACATSYFVLRLSGWLDL